MTRYPSVFLREDRQLIPKFVEETLRLDGPIKGVFRMARKTTTLPA